MILILLILVMIAEFMRTWSKHINRIFKGMPILTLLIISCVGVLFANMILFPTIYYLGKTQNVIILHCTIIGCSIISAMLINRYIIGETVSPASYLALCAILAILIIHHMATADFYSKVKKMV